MNMMSTSDKTNISSGPTALNKCASIQNINKIFTQMSSIKRPASRKKVTTEYNTGQFCTHPAHKSERNILVVESISISTPLKLQG